MGEKRVACFKQKTSGKWILYEYKEPKYLLDCFNLTNEASLRLNDLLFSEKKTIQQIVKGINKKHKRNLSLEKPPLLKFVKETTIEDMTLKGIPCEWLE
jgi:hypothetical protein